MNGRRAFNRILSQKTFNNNRPKTSLKSCSSFINRKNNITAVFIKSPHSILTKPNNSSKKLKGMGNKFEREELYQLNQELKTKVNTLKDELYDAKSQIAKKDREIMRKEKIIEDCCKEIYNPSFSYQKSFDKAKESTLLSLCKEQYNQLKKDYDKLSEENNILNMNIKITKIKEYQIQINTLKSEMTKLTHLYKSAISENEILKRKINELIEFRKKYCQQHCIIDKCMKKVNDYNNNLIELELVNEDLKNELNKKTRKTQFFKCQNNKLKLSNEKILKSKKMKDYFDITNYENVTKIIKLQKELDEYKRLYNLREQQIKKYENMENKNKKREEEAKVFNYNKIIDIEKEPNKDIDSQNKIKLLKSLLEEKQKEIDIFSKYLILQNLNPKSILQETSINNDSNLNINNLNNMNNSHSNKINNSIKNLKSDKKIDDKTNSNLSNSNIKKDNRDKNKDNTNTGNSNDNEKNLLNNQNEENNSQLYNAAVIDPNDNENENNTEEKIKDSDLNSNNN